MACCATRYVILCRPLYLVTNMSGREYPRWANHFDPYSPIYSRRERSEILVSDCALGLAFSALFSLAKAFGWMWLAKVTAPHQAAFISAAGSPGPCHGVLILAGEQQDAPNACMAAGGLSRSPAGHAAPRLCGVLTGGLHASAGVHCALFDCQHVAGHDHPAAAHAPLAAALQRQGVGVAARRPVHRRPLIRFPGRGVPPHR